jgi:hypothetical protein
VLKVFKALLDRLAQQVLQEPTALFLDPLEPLDLQEPQALIPPFLVLLVRQVQRGLLAQLALLEYLDQLELLVLKAQLGLRVLKESKV